MPSACVYILIPQLHVHRRLRVGNNIRLNCNEKNQFKQNILEVQKAGIYSTLTIATVTENCHQSKLKTVILSYRA